MDGKPARLRPATHLTADPRQHFRVLQQVHDAALSGSGARRRSPGR